jgi:hypothetical protein
MSELDLYPLEIAAAHIQRINDVVTGLADTAGSWAEITTAAREAHQAELGRLDAVLAFQVAEAIRRHAPALATWLEGPRPQSTDWLAAYAGVKLRPQHGDSARYQC